MLDETKLKVETIVNLYIELFPEEYLNFSRGNKKKQNSQLNKFSEIKGDMEMRQLHEMPEVLYNLLNFKLTKDEFEDLFSVKGAEWFARKFKIFKIAEKI